MGKKGFLMGTMVMSCMLVACNSQKEEKTADAVSVKSEVVSGTDESIIGVAYVGEVEAQSSTSVGFTGSGTVLRVLVEEGQHVNKGQLIAEIDDTQSRNAVMAAEAMMTQAQDAYDRMKVLHDRQSLSEMDWVEVQSRVQQAKSTLQMAQKSLEDCRLVAPCSGVIGSKMMEAGMVALPAQPVCRILDIRNVKVKVSVPEKDVVNVAPEATISVDALGGDSFVSKGVERGVTADAISRTYDVRYLVDNADGRLLPGMVCNVQSRNNTSSQSDDFITVPVTSVQRSADGTMFVWTVKEGVAHRTKVEVGKASGNRVIVTQGLKKGDEVVIKGYQKLYENCKVK